MIRKESAGPCGTTLLVMLLMGSSTLALAAPLRRSAPVTVKLPDTMKVNIREPVGAHLDSTVKVWLVEPKTIPISMPRKPIPDPAWGLAGVLIGAFLGEGLRRLHERRRIARLKAALRDECRSLLLQVPQLIEICEHMVASLHAHRFLPGPAVTAMRGVYDAALTELMPHMSSVERNLLHVVHERLKVGDELIANYHRDLLEALRDQQITGPWGVWINKFGEQIGSYRITEQLLKGYIAGAPEDVFNLQVHPERPRGADS